MLLRADLRKIARAKLQDAEALLKASRYDAAWYICGYAVECALKARIVSTLKWPGFPETRKEFEGYQSFKTHDLEILLHLCGREAKVRNNHLTEWSGVTEWDPEIRYKQVGTFTQ